MKPISRVNNSLKPIKTAQNSQSALNTTEKGKIGEDVACSYLIKRGFTVVQRNYRKRWGEIDIVAHDAQGLIHFIEVKAVSGRSGIRPNRGVSREALSLDSIGHRPEDNVHNLKIARLRRTILSYMAESSFDRIISTYKISRISFCVDIVTVVMDFESRRARVDMLENVIL